jgi:glycosyltransferase involved in cell wall biosynthesis
MAEVVSRLPEAILAVAGEGDLLEDSIERSASLGESIRFLGWRQDLAPLYAAADVVAISSDNEGMPVTLIEAAMAGIPAVTTDVGSAGEVVVDGVTGYVVPPDVEALAEGLVGLLTDHEIRARMGGEARLRAEELFGVERLVADHARLYERLVDGGRASPRRRGRGW